MAQQSNTPDRDQSHEDVRQPNRSPFSKFVQSMSEQSPYGINPNIITQLTFKDDLIQDIIQSSILSPSCNYPRITKGFNKQEENPQPNIIKKLTFMKSPVLNKLPFSPQTAKGSLTAKKPPNYDSPRVLQLFNQLNTESRSRNWQQPQIDDIESENPDLECNEEDDDQHAANEHSENNLCPKCLITFQKPSHQEEYVPHQHGGNFGYGEQSLSFKRQNQQAKIENSQFQESNDRGLQFKIMTSKKQQQEKKYEHHQHIFQSNNTVRKRPRKEAVNPTIVAVAQEDIKCNCSKSKCIKLYCDCFAANQLCGKNCSCYDCKNHDHHNHDRRVAIKQILERNPSAFQPKVQLVIQQDEDFKHLRGCNCKKSNCLKKYCECYQMKVKCSDLCKCDGCKNCSTPQQSRRKGRMREDLTTKRIKYN